MVNDGSDVGIPPASAVTDLANSPYRPTRQREKGRPRVTAGSSPLCQHKRCCFVALVALLPPAPSQDKVKWSAVIAKHAGSSR